MKEILSNVSLDLMPDENAAYCLDDQSRKCNFLFNKLLKIAFDALKSYHETKNKDCTKLVYSPYGLRNLVPSIKEAFPYLKSVYAAPLKNAALRLTAAFMSSFKSKTGKRKGKKVQMPRFRAWKNRWFSLLYDEPYVGYYIEENILYLSLGMGTKRKRHSLAIPIKDAFLLKNKEIRNLRIVKEHGRFRAVFTVVRRVPDTKSIEKVIALDPNHKNFAYGVDNLLSAVEIQAPHWLKVFDKRIDELRSKLAHCNKKSKQIKIENKDGTITIYWEASRKYKKLQNTLYAALAKRRELTKAFCYRLANYLYKHYDLVIMGDYAPQGQGLTTAMRRSMNNRSLLGIFKKILAWVALKSGKSYHEFDERGTTRTCHACGLVVQDGIHPSLRAWECTGCEAEHIRDENAAINELKRVLGNLREISGNQLPLVPGSGLVQVIERWTWRVLSSGSIIELRG